MTDASTQTGPEPPTRRPLKETTTKKYEQAIERLKDLDLKKSDEFFEYVREKGLGESAEKQHLSAIKWYLTKENKSFPNAYQKRIDELYGKQNEQDNKQELKPKLLAKFVPFDKLMEAQKKLEDADKTEKQWLDYLVASLYTLNPPIRNEFGDMKVYKRRDARRKGNELIWSKKPVIVMRDYKTNGTNGAVELPLSKPLQQAITAWFGHLGVIPPYVFGTKYSDTASLKLIASAFGTTGKFLGVDNLRHAYIQHHLPAIATNLEKRRILADRMLHSIETQLKYFSQNITQEEE